MRYEPAGPSQPDSPPRHVYISVKDPSQPSSAEPVEIKVGMTLAEVEAALGRPSRIARLEDKVVVYRYEDTVVEFKNDKVSHVRFE